MATNIFPGKAIYGLIGYLIVVDERTGAIQLQRVGTSCQSTLTRLWFDLTDLQSLPQRPYECQKLGAAGTNVWDEYII